MNKHTKNITAKAHYLILNEPNKKKPDKTSSKQNHSSSDKSDAICP